MKGFLSRFFFFILIFVSSGSLYAAGYPESVNDYVNDFANVMSSPDKEAVTKLFEKVEHQTGREIVVVTINSMSDYGVSETTIESFATKLFNTWGVGHKKSNDGVLILVSVKDRKCRIELGGAFAHYYDSVMNDVVQEKMIPYFRTDDYSRGIYEGARGVVESITKEVPWYSFYKWHIVAGILAFICIIAGISCIRSGKKGWGWAFFAVAGVILIFLFKALASGKSSGGFGGGSSGGGGASGSW